MCYNKINDKRLSRSEKFKKEPAPFSLPWVEKKNNYVAVEKIVYFSLGRWVKKPERRQEGKSLKDRRY